MNDNQPKFAYVFHCCGAVPWLGLGVIVRKAPLIPKDNLVSGFKTSLGNRILQPLLRYFRGNFLRIIDGKLS